MGALPTALALVLAADPAPASDPPADRDDAAESNAAPWIVQLRPRRHLWELGGFAGVFVLPDDHDLYDLDTAPQKPFRRAGPEAGLRAAYFPIGLFGIEGEFDGVWSKVRAPLGEPVFVWGARAHAILQLPLYRIVPFVLGGYGLMGVRSPRDAVGNDVDPTGHYGVGVKLYLTRWLALRLDGRHLMSAAAAKRRTVTHHGSVIFGLSVTLGRGRAGV